MKASEVDLNKWQEGMSLLAQSGIFTFLRNLCGKVHYIPPTVPNYAEMHIAENNRSIGYNQALDELYRFRELFIDLLNPHNTPPMDYGSINSLIARKIISIEEGDELKRKLFSRSDKPGFSPNT